MTLDLSLLKAGQIEKLPPELIEGLRPYRRLLAQKLLKAGKTADWARGLTIRTPRGMVEMAPYHYQENFWRAGQKERFRIVLKARQVGITQALVIEMLAAAATKPEALVLFVSARQETANEALAMFYQLVESEGEAGFRVTEKTKTSCRLEGGGRVVCLPASMEAVVGYAATEVYLDEFAHMPFATDIYEQIFPTISINGRICIVSTPRGQSGRFFELWRAAALKQNDFWPLRVHWAECPAYNPHGWNDRRGLDRKIEIGKRHAWYKAMRPNHSDVEWARLFECDFVASVDMFFSEGTMDWLRSQVRKPTEEEKDSHGSLKIYRQPEKKARYMIGVDPASGLSHGDWSAAVVVDVGKAEEVALLRGHWPPSEFAYRLYDLRRRGYEGLMVIERAGVGLAVLEKLVELDPSALYRAEDKRVGWVTSGKTRPVMLAAMEEACRRRELRPRSEEFVQEAEVFVRDDRGIPGAARNQHDDIVMALAMAWYVRAMAPAGMMQATEWAPRYGKTSRAGY